MESEAAAVNTAGAMLPAAIVRWSRGLLEYYGINGSPHCAGFAFAVLNKSLAQGGRCNTEITSTGSVWEMKEKIGDRYFLKVPLFGEFEKPQKAKFRVFERIYCSMLSPRQANAIRKQLLEAPAGSMLTVLYARTQTGLQDGRGVNDPSHALTCIGNGVWVDEIGCKVNAYEPGSIMGFLKFNRDFKFVENSLLYIPKKEAFAAAARKVEYTPAMVGMGGRRHVSPVDFAVKIRERTGMQFEYVLAEILSQNEISVKEGMVKVDGLRVELNMPAKGRI